jgi:hypothetical protein
MVAQHYPSTPYFLLLVAVPARPAGPVYVLGTIDPG